MNMFKKVVMLIGMLFSVLTMPFLFLLPFLIREYFYYGIWGEMDSISGKGYRVLVPQFGAMGIEQVPALGLNYFFSYLYIISVFVLFLFFIFKLLNRIIHFLLDYANEEKTVRKFRKTKLDNLVFASALYMLAIFLTIILLNKYIPHE